MVESPHTVRHKWVMGHADSKMADPKKITWIEHVNIDCDKVANDCVERNVQPQPFQPHPGYKAMIKIGNEWNPSNFCECVKQASTGPIMIAFIKQQLNIS